METTWDELQEIEMNTLSSNKWLMACIVEGYKKGGDYSDTK